MSRTGGRCAWLWLALAACGSDRATTSAIAQADDQNGGSGVAPPTVVAMLNSPTAITARQLDYGETDDYAPVDKDSGTSFTNALVVRLTAADNEGSFVTGLAAGTVGDFHVVCNQGGTIDGGQLVLRHEDAGSQPANRFHTPDDSDVKLPKDACVFVTYDVDSRWMVIAPGGRATRAIVQSLQLDSSLTTDLLSGTLVDWAPIDAWWSQFGYSHGFCPNGNSCRFADNTMIRARTLDATGATLTGMQWLTNADPAGLGPVKIIVNYGGGPIVVTDEDPRSMPGNQFLLPGRRSWTIPYPGSATFWHGDNEPFWQLVAATSQAPDGSFPVLTTKRPRLAPAATPDHLPAGVVADWNPGADFADASVVRAQGGQGTVLTGIASDGVAPGDVKVVHNFGLAITVTCFDATSQAQNRIACAQSFTLAQWATMTLRYDQNLFWFVVSHT